MASSGQFKSSWPIWVLVVVAVGFVVLAFMKEKPRAEAPAKDVLAQTSSSDTALTIKPQHTPEDQAALASKKGVEAVIEPLKEVTSKNVLAIQVYSFKEKARADASLAKLKEKGYSAYIMVSDLGARGIWYRVRVGPFENEVEAQKLLGAINNDFKSGILVTE